MTSFSFNWDQWRPLMQTATEYAPGALTLVLVMVTARVGTELTWEVMGGREYTSAAVAVPARARGDTGAGATGDEASIDQIVERNLFGLADAEDAPSAGAPIDAPETRLNLKLKGIFAAGSAERSRAIIAEGDRAEQTYSIGDSIPGNATLQEIYSDRVIIRRGGSLEALRLPRLGDENGAPQRTARAPDRTDADTDGLAEMREQILDDPQQITQLVRFRPVYRNGEFQGYRVYPGQNQQAFRDTGLRPGDLVKTVNGVELDDPQKVMGLINELADASSVNVELDRRGSSESVTISLDR